MALDLTDYEGKARKAIREFWAKRDLARQRQVDAGKVDQGERAGVTAYRERAFGEQSRPFLGWLMLLEDAPASREPVQVRSPHFPVSSDFQEASYADRYNILCKKLLQEQLYSAACILKSPRSAIDTGEYYEVSEITGLRNFATELAGHIAAEAARP